MTIRISKYVLQFSWEMIDLKIQAIKRKTRGNTEWRTEAWRRAKTKMARRRVFHFPRCWYFRHCQPPKPRLTLPGQTCPTCAESSRTTPWSPTNPWSIKSQRISQPHLWYPREGSLAWRVSGHQGSQSWAGAQGLQGKHTGDLQSERRWRLCGWVSPKSERGLTGPGWPNAPPQMLRVQP